MKQNGFTLIEILISLVVMLTVTGSVLVGYKNFNTSEKLRQAGKTLRNDLRFIQTRSTSGLKPVGVACTTLQGYQVSFTATSYRFQSLCTEGLVGPISTVTLPSDISFSPIPSAIVFHVLTGTTNQTTSVVLIGSGKSITIQVSPSGDVSELPVVN